VLSAANSGPREDVRDGATSPLRLRCHTPGRQTVRLTAGGPS
jgi:hypothetical protein